MSIWLDQNGRRHVGIMVRGRRVHRKLAEGASASAARRVEAELRAGIERRGVAVPGDPPLPKILDLYLDHAKTMRSGDTSRHHAMRIAPWTEGMRASHAPRVAATFKREAHGHYSPDTINRSLGTLKKASSLAYELDLIPENYGARIKLLPPSPGRDVVLTLEQVGKLTAATQSDAVRAAIWLGVFTGMRRSELLALRREDIGTDTITVRAESTKTLKVRMVPIVEAARPWLRFVPLALNFEGLKTGFGRARVRAGLPHVRFHDLRRTCGTLMVEGRKWAFARRSLEGRLTRSPPSP
jgi:integrase